MTVFVGLDWAEDHHDLCVLDQAGRRLGKARVANDLAGLAKAHELIAAHAEEPGEVVLAAETDRGMFIGALIAAGYRVLAVNPMSVARYRERHSTSGAKSDPGDALVLAELARVDAHLHREVAGDSDLVQGLRLVARAHQSLIWTRQRQANQLRSHLRDYFPGFLAGFESASSPEALEVLAAATTPERARTMSQSKIAAALRRGGRQRRIEERAAEIQAALRSEQLTATPVVAEAMGTIVASLVAVLRTLNSEIDRLEAELADRFDQHPDAKVVRSLPGLGTVLGARVLSEFGDDPNRYLDAKSRKNYAGTSPITRASGRNRVVLARYARNRRLNDACYLWAFSALSSSPGARAFYDQHRAAGDTHNRALRALANRLVGILHGCLRHHTPYDEHTAWGHRVQAAA